MAVYGPPGNEELYHYGIKRRSGRYPYGSGKNPFQSRKRNLKLDDDLVLEKGTKIYRVTKSIDDPSPNRKYFTVDNADRMKYKDIWGSKMMQIYGDAYESQYSTTRDLSIPSFAKRIEMADELYKDPKIKELVETQCRTEILMNLDNIYEGDVDYGRGDENKKIASAVYDGFNKAFEASDENVESAEEFYAKVWAGFKKDNPPGSKYAVDYVDKTYNENIQYGAYRTHLVYAVAGSSKSGDYKDASSYTMQKLQNLLQKNGYDATIDEYDTLSVGANAPIIIFNPDSAMMRTKVSKLSENEIASAKKWVDKNFEKEKYKYIPSANETWQNRHNKK